MMNAIVYCTTNKVNGKKYIGSHAGGDPNYLGSGVNLAKAIRKHGRGNFIRQTLWEGPLEYMREMEEYYIDYYSAYESQLFYNASKKGTGCVAGKPKSKEHRAGISASKTGTKYSEESKAKMSASKIGKPKSEEHKAKISETLTGRIFSDEHIVKLSKALKGRKQNVEHKAKLIASRTGKKRSDETIAKMSASRTGMKYNKHGK